MSKNANLTRAKREKNDEFYTQRADIEAELGREDYWKHFKNAMVFCNCDDPRESEFWRYFHSNFSFLGLKKLISTHFEKEGRKEGRKEDLGSYALIYEGEKPGTLSAIEREDVSNGRKVKLKGNGDFRSDECIKFLKEADIVVTNPPFSLFREYVAQLMEYEKKFVIIGNQNALTYKEIFPLIKDNKLRCGYISGSRTFLAPDDYPGNCFEKDGRKWVTMGNTCWFTNLDLRKAHDPLSLVEEYNLHPERYPKYDNYDAIEVPKVSLIPKDYFGVMGVPITFFDKYCNEQFEVVGLDRYVPDNPHYGKRFTIKDKEIYARVLIRRKSELIPHKT